jgi:hypothetical protein
MSDVKLVYARNCQWHLLNVLPQFLLCTRTSTNLFQPHWYKSIHFSWCPRGTGSQGTSWERPIPWALSFSSCWDCQEHKAPSTLYPCHFSELWLWWVTMENEVKSKLFKGCSVFSCEVTFPVCRCPPQGTGRAREIDPTYWFSCSLCHIW